MDARRLGVRPGLPQAFLEAAAPGYLTGAEWDALGEDWLEQTLRYTAKDAKGVRGPLTRIRPRPARHAPTPMRTSPAVRLPGQGRCTGSRTTWTSTAGRTAPARSPRRRSGPPPPCTPRSVTRPRSAPPPTPAAYTGMPPSCTRRRRNR